MRDARSVWDELEMNIEIYKLAGYFNPKNHEKQAYNRGEIIENIKKIVPEELYKDFNIHGLINVGSDDSLMLLAQLFAEMNHYKFNVIRSATQSDLSRDIISIKHYDTSLLKHSIGMYTSMVTICNEKNIVEHIRGSLLIAALAHDFGKCEDIRLIYVNQKDFTTPHQKISMLYIKNFLNNYYKKTSNQTVSSTKSVDFIIRILEGHHGLTSGRGVEQYVEYLNLAEERTRREEKESF